MALIYVSFILIYLAIGVINRGPVLSEREKLINVLEITKEAVLDDLDSQERKRTLELVEDCNGAGPVARAFKGLALRHGVCAGSGTRIYTRIKSCARCFYHRLLRKKWFDNAVIAFFILQSILTLVVSALFLILLVLAGGQHAGAPFFGCGGGRVASAAAAILVAAGVMRIRRNRELAYQLFKYAILVQILLVQVFVFYKEQFAALTSLAVNIGVLLVLRYMISQEKTSRIC